MKSRDDGAAMVEFVLLAVVLVVPLCYIVLAVFELQNAAFGANAATREAARVFVRAPSTATGQHQAQAAAELTLNDHGIELDPSSLTLSCSATPCLTPGATVKVAYRTTVPLPFIPVIGSREMVTIPITAAHTQVVDEYSEIRP